MSYNDEFIKKIIQMGILGYQIDKIINVLDIEDVKSFTIDFKNKNSEIYKAYQKGLDKSDFVIDSKLFEMAKNGDLKALEKYENRKNYSQICKKSNCSDSAR